MGRALTLSHFHSGPVQLLKTAAPLHYVTSTYVAGSWYIDAMYQAKWSASCLHWALGNYWPSSREPIQASGRSAQLLPDTRLLVHWCTVVYHQHTRDWWNRTVQIHATRTKVGLTQTVTNFLLASLVSCWTSYSLSRTLLLAWWLEPENLITSLVWCNSLIGYHFGKGSVSKQPFWCSSVCMDCLRYTPRTAANRQLTTMPIHTCDQPTCVCCLFHEHSQPMVTGVLLSVEQSCGTFYLWHWDQVTLRITL